MEEDVLVKENELLKKENLELKERIMRLERDLCETCMSDGYLRMTSAESFLDRVKQETLMEIHSDDIGNIVKNLCCNSQQKLGI